ELPYSNEVVVEVISMAGQTMYTTRRETQAGFQAFSLPTAGLSPGSYVVRGVFADGSTFQQKLLVTK
ncbi:MAG: T9SS type A sorting domain-containing protein, partial [Bacteroidota bacterium]